MTTITHLTPTELDALLEAATALDERWELHHGEHSLRVCNGQHDALGGCQTLVEAEILGHSRWSSESRAKFVSLANPATITRLVLMVRELQRDVEVSRRLVSRNLHDQIEGVFGNQQYITERFRARAIQELRKLYEVNTPHSADISLGYTTALEKALTVIKSLPLVETEGGVMKITYFSENDTDYVAGLKAAQTEDTLKDFLKQQRFIASDAYKAATSDGFDWEEFQRGRKIENSGRFAGEEWAAKYGAILMPEILIRVGVVAQNYGAPWGCAYIRLREAGCIRETRTHAQWIEQ